MSGDLKTKLINSLEDMARKGYRTVSVAYKPVDGKALAREPARQNRAQDVLEQI